MKTKDRKAVICETCHITMQKRKAKPEDLDINKLSLLSMFGINNFYILQCPECNKIGLQIG